MEIVGQVAGFKSRFIEQFLVVLICLFPLSSYAQDPLVAGANVNMVSGVGYPGGDQFLQRQNEPSLAVSTRNILHLLGGANDYRSVDIPGLPDGKAVGDSWPGIFSSVNGGGSWVSTLLPGFPQDKTQSPSNPSSPLFGYEAGADPVIRAGTNGLFYYSGIVFNRGVESPSATFVARFMDLNNDPSTPKSFEEGPIRYIDTEIVDADPGGSGSEFIDKPWMAVDIPRVGSQSQIIQVPQGNGTISQTINCGSVYLAYARIAGEDSADIDSRIMFSRSLDCGDSFTDPIVLDDLDFGVSDRTINQGASVAIDPGTGYVYVSWRQFNNATLSCTRRSDFWESNPEVWPVENVLLGEYIYTKEEALKILRGNEDDATFVLARELIATKLNVFSGANDGDIADAIEQADAWIAEQDLGNYQKRSEEGDKNSEGETRKESVEIDGKVVVNLLQQYNTGEIGPGSCDDFAMDAIFGDENPDAIMVVRSTDFGETFSAPVMVSELIPFDQGTTKYSFRANSYPTMTVDDSGRVYIAWSSRGLPGEPEYADSRIVVSTSLDGKTWTMAPSPVDVDPSKPRGHQIQPSIAFSNGKLILIYLDFRQDRSLIFERFIADINPGAFRHTVDVRAAQADPSTAPEFANYSILNGGSAQLSRYFNLMLNATPDAQTATPFREQLQYNPLNQPLFKGGTVPFIGDYIDVAPSPAFLPNQDGSWRYNTGTDDSPVFHAAWSDNRDVREPPDDDWTTYVPPTDPESDGFSVFDRSLLAESCVQGVNDDRTGMRNQNIYTSRISQGLYVAIPGNFKRLNSALPRSFVIYAKYSNDSIAENEPREQTFVLSIPRQPPGGQASFDQFTFDDEIQVTVGNNSSMARTVFVTSTDSTAPVDVVVSSLNGDLRGIGRINSDASNPFPLVQVEKFSSAVLDSEDFFKSNVFENNPVFDSRDDGTLILKHDPDNPFLFEQGKINTTLEANQLEFLSQALLQLSLSNPDVFNPGIYNPGIYNPGIYNPGIYNPGIYNPGIYNPGIYNPGIYNPGIYNPGIYNPGIYNPGIYNGTIADANYTIINDGVSATSYNVNLRLDAPSEDYTYQLIVSRINTTPVADGCTLIEAPMQEVLLNDNNPELQGDLLSSDSDDSFYLEPGDTAIVTLRIIPKVEDPDPIEIDRMLSEVSIGVIPDVVDDGNALQGETQPKLNVVLNERLKANPLSIIMDSLDDAKSGTFYSVQLRAMGGSGPRSWSLAPGASLPAGLLLSDSGLISGTPLVGGSFNFTVRVKDSTQINELGLTLEISGTADLVVSSLTRSPTSPDSSDLITFTAVVLNQGEEPAPASELEFRIGSEAPSEAIHFRIPMLAPGDDYTVTRATTLDAQSYTNIATADIHNVVVESNVANNVTTDAYTVLQELQIATSSPLPDSQLGAVYAEQLVANGGSGPQAWSLVSGDLPTGLRLSSSGEISGTPEALGIFSFVARTADITQTAEKAFSITINSGSNILQWSVNGHYYQFVATGDQSWTQANTAAKSTSYLGSPGHLLTITSAAEQEFVNSVRLSMGLSDWRPWIGLNDAAVEGTFTWVTGEAVTYTNWSGGEPSNSSGIEDYVEMFGSGVWNDLPNGPDFPDGYIVEFEPAFSSYTTTLAFPQPSSSVTVDRVVWGWSTTSASGTISRNNLSELSMALYNGTTLEYFDHIVGNGVVLPIAGNPGAAVGRPDVYVYWDFDLDMLKLEQFRNLLWSPLEITNGTQYLVTDGASLSSDGQIKFYKQSDGTSVGGGTGILNVQWTVKNYP